MAEPVVGVGSEDEFCRRNLARGRRCRPTNADRTIRHLASIDIEGCEFLGPELLRSSRSNRTALATTKRGFLIISVSSPGSRMAWDLSFYLSIAA